MSLYEMHYILHSSEESRVREQQATLQKALQDLSIKSKLEQQQEHDKLLSKQYLREISEKHSAAVNFDLWLHSTNYTVVANECRPYSPYYTENSIISDTASVSAHSSRQRTPSMVSASSSYMSENTTTTASSFYSKEDDRCFNASTYILSER
jgi:hypothetical protein